MRAKFTARNKKNGSIYEIISLDITDATNGANDQRMVLYQKDGVKYVRNYNEFFEKFDQVKTK